MTRKMKDSGIEWIGEIPEDWELVKNKYLFKSKKKAVGNKFKAFNLLSLTKRKGIIYRDIENMGGKLPESFSTYQSVEKDDLVLCLFDLDISAVFSDVSKFDGMISSAYNNFEIKNDHPMFYKYWFDMINDGRKYKIYSKSLRYTIDIDNFNSLLSVKPPISQQKAIANFLDKKTQEIDNIISKTKKAIEEYKKYKQSLITETVTKGLDKNVKMKDSGIEWIGEIPEHWDVSKIKYFYNITLGKMLQPRQRNNDETKEYYISAINIQDDVDLSIEKQMWFSKNEKSMYKIEKGDLLTVEGGHAGKSILWEYSNLDKEYYFQNSILRARNKFNSDNRFLKYWMQSLRGVGYLDYICNKATIAHFTREKYLNTEIVVLDYKEQEQIAAYLDQKCSQIDQIISTKEKLLIEMEAYKKSLIYETVTGKREVE